MAQHPLRVTNAGIVKVHWDDGGGVFTQNVFGIMGTAQVPVDQAMADALNTAIKSAYPSSGLAAVCAATHSLDHVSVKSIDQENLTEFEGASSSNPGTGVGDELPRSVACVVTLRTAFSGKQNRGRVFIGGFTEAENSTTSTIDAAAIQGALNFVGQVQNAINARGIQMAIVSRPLWQEQEPPLSDIQVRAGHVNPVTSMGVRNSIWGSQRNRLHRT